MRQNQTDPLPYQNVGFYVILIVELTLPRMNCQFTNLFSTLYMLYAQQTFCDTIMNCLRRVFEEKVIIQIFTSWFTFHLTLFHAYPVMKNTYRWLFLFIHPPSLTDDSCGSPSSLPVVIVAHQSALRDNFVAN